MHFGIRCTRCDATTTERHRSRCAACGGTLGFTYERPRCWPAGASRMWDHAELLPIPPDVEPVTLGEGGTPLVAAAGMRGARVFWKNEGANPTGSQKDRAISVAMTHARSIGAARIAVASTGSVGLACAAYSAKARLPCLILMPRGTPAERLTPMLAFGATVVAVDATFEAIETLLRSLDDSWFQASTIAALSPYQAEGPKTIAYEIVAQLDAAPDWMVVPVGGGGTLAGIWRGFEDLHRLGRIQRLPRMVGVQTRTFNALELAMARGLRTMDELASIAADERLETIARNLKHGVPPDATGALRALRDSGGCAISVDEAAIRAWHSRLAAEEGILAEPSSAAAPAGIDTLLARGVIAPGERVVALITGSGLREPSALPRGEPIAMPGSLDAADLDRLVPRRGPPTSNRETS
ncbi:MAG: threonine synthase [Alphaproteobacteria bacterium]|nr:threonine synthase [Alphaproteobacteria bacterium]